MRVFSAIVLGAFVLLSAGPAGAQADNAAKIVGKWEVVKGEDIPKGATVEFTKDGKVSIVANIDKKEVKFEGTYTVEKDKLVTKITVDGKTAEDTDTIKKLTDDTLEIEDKDNKVTTLSRKK